MKYVALLTLFVPTVVGCASGGGANDMAMEQTAGQRRARPRKQTTFETSTGATQMGVENEAGVYEGADIEDVMSAHMEEVRDCYGRAGHAQRYAAGKVTLRFKVTGTGAPSEVLVIATDLGNFDVERCVVEVGRRIKFPPPEGRKATTFEYPVEFRSTEEMKVQDLDESLKIDHDMATLIHSLAPCGPITESGASALFYIEPNGAVASVGLAADSALDERAGACMVKEMHHWRMSATLPGRMLRCRVNIPAVIAAAEPPPPFKSPVGRRRRR